MRAPSVNTVCSSDDVFSAQIGGDLDMRVAAATGLGLFVVGAALTWVAAWTVVGATLMIAGSAGLLSLILLSATRNASSQDEGLEALEPVEEPHDRFTAGWPRR
jgi:hypothetical protein